MCPEDNVLSCYFDGELESHWARKVEAHLQDCARCGDRLRIYQKVRDALASANEPDVRRSMGQVRQSLEVAQSARIRAVPLIRRRFAVSIPAAAAVCVFAVTAGFLVAMLVRRTDLRLLQVRKEPSGTSFQVAAPIEDLEQLIKALGADFDNRELTIQLPELPEQHHFIMINEKPRFLKEAEMKEEGW